MLRITLIIGLLMVSCAVAGCFHPGSGFLGGQGISISATEGSHIENVNITIEDGGFYETRPNPTTQPKE